MVSLSESLGLTPNGSSKPTSNEVFEELRDRIMLLNARIWENRVDWPLVRRWLDNFDGSSGVDCQVERLHALYILSQFLYYGSVEIRVLLRALYRDLFLIPAVQRVRALRGGTRDEALIASGLQTIFASTRFLGVGSPSESGVHLLYYFRQENRLSKSDFLDTAQILERDTSSPSGRKLRFPTVKRYIFVDDVCGSGDTARRYSTDFLNEMASMDPTIEFHYFCMFAKKEGLDYIKKNTVFRDNVAAVFEFDGTYKCLSPTSRYLRVVPPNIEPDIVRNVATFYGGRLLPDNPTGFEDGQMLIGFHHNTPDNTLPIIWMDPENQSPVPWCPIFADIPRCRPGHD